MISVLVPYLKAWCFLLMAFLPLQPMYDIIPRPHPSLASDWMVLVILFILVVLAWVGVRTPGYFARQFAMLGNVRMMRQAMQEENVSLRPDAALLFCYYLLGALLLVHLSRLFGWTTGITQPVYNFALFTGVLMVTYTVKSAFIRLIGWLVRHPQGIDEYTGIISLCNRTLLLVLFPLVVSLTYMPVPDARQMVWAILILLSGVLLFRLFRGVQAAAEYRIPVTYLFFYICTFEILPMLVAYRVLNL